ncbi:branched-chain amino acid ABC transporter permease [Pimelobacter simplex]|uniref:Branched-chain amino acid ABC transporter permease n=1 Tax=Nocardioides simplex TaxID=2045 RepID=A0A7J5DZ10_NOCSI|nr:branched-chain amino acid ABC transporter permease [Pimelobacter simplex]KAB2810914.1 branched-chain amino acid ABC transporter permease [Pimelobacter simplex]
MSDTATSIAAPAAARSPGAAAGSRPGARSLGRAGRLVVVALVALVLVLPPFYLDRTWLLIGILSMAAAVAAIGLTVLVGTAGQLSLAHAFFVAVGAYSYAYLAGGSEQGAVSGLALPPLLAAPLAVALAGLVGLAFGPVATRLGGLYLGVASLALVFIGAHLLKNATSVTGGYNGRQVEPLTVGDRAWSGSGAELLTVLGVPFGGTERLWYVAGLVLLVATVAAHRVIRGRPGRALLLMRDNAAAAGSMGVPVRRLKMLVFSFSSLFAGAGGVLTALAAESLVPQHFDLHLSIIFLAAVIIGGLGSVGGAVAGAVFVTSLPLVLERSSHLVGVLDSPGSGGLDPSTASQLVFGAALVLVLVAEPGGLAGIARRLRQAISRRRDRDTPGTDLDPD